MKLRALMERTGRSGKWGEKVNVVGSAYCRLVWGSGMLLGCLETPPAFLEAVASAWTVTRGVVTVTSSVSPPAHIYCRGSSRM
jgi:hypothetical protein